MIIVRGIGAGTHRRNADGDPSEDGRYVVLSITDDSGDDYNFLIQPELLDVLVDQITGKMPS